jgi:hypothetical protein
LVCDASKLKGAANATMGPYELDKGFAFNDLRPLLEKQFGQAVFFEYQEYTEAGYLGDVRKVQDEDAFDEMLDYIEEDAEGDNPVYEGALDIKLYAAPPSKKDEAPPASKDAKAHILKRTLYRAFRSHMSRELTFENFSKVPPAAKPAGKTTDKPLAK